MSQEVDISTMEQCVRDAGFEEEYDPEQLKEVYSALKDSMIDDDELVTDLQKLVEDRGSQPIDKDEIKSKVSPSIPQDSAIILNRDPLCSSTDDDSPVIKNRVHKDKSIIYDWKADIHFNDMPASNKKNTLTIIYHELKYINIQNSPEFLTADLKQKTKILLNYHVAMAKLKTEYARSAAIKAPLPKPILATAAVSPSLYSFKEEDLEKETYVSRSGRMTKRKVYCDNDDFVEETGSTKKSKSSETEWLSKNSNTKTSKSKKTENLKESNGVHMDTASETENTEEPEKPRPRLSLLKRLSNDTIMARSSLFRDTTNEPKSRSELLFDNLKKAEEEKQKSEKSMDLFNKTLDQLDEEAESDTIMVDDDVVEEKSVRRRVVPLLPARRPIGSRKKKDAFEALPIKTQPAGTNAPETSLSTSTITSSQESNQSTSSKPNSQARKRNLRTIKETPDTTAASSSGNGNSNKGARGVFTVICPICSNYFKKDHIEEHASSCGDGDIIPQTTNKVSSITCNICDEVVPFFQDYEVHVMECKKKHGDQS